MIAVNKGTFCHLCCLKFGFSALQSRGTRCGELPSCSRAQLDPNTHLQMWHSSHSISVSMKTPSQELPSATVFAFTVAELHAGLSGCWWLIPPLAFQKGSAFPGAAQKCSQWSSPSPDLGREGWGNQCYSSKVISQPQITAQEGMSGPEHTRDFVQGFSLVVVLEFLWASMKLSPLWNQV